MIHFLVNINQILANRNVHHSLDDIKKKKVRLFQRKEALPKAKAQQVLSIHGGIPCNLAPAHFTVHIVQVRLNFALGSAREPNPA